MPKPLITIKIGSRFKFKFSASPYKKIIFRIFELLALKPALEMSVLITDDRSVHKLNKEYRKIDRTTDVLSFYMPLSDINGREDNFIMPPDLVTHIGEIVISFEQAERQAGEHGLTTEGEIVVLTVHGILHLLGYDHEKLKDRKKMELKEKQILSDLNLKKNI
jgi:probable rRNA maturation factor